MKTDTCRQALRANEQRFYLLQYARCLIFFRNVMNYRDSKKKSSGQMRQIYAYPSEDWLKTG